MLFAVSAYKWQLTSGGAKLVVVVKLSFLSIVSVNAKQERRVFPEMLLYSFCFPVGSNYGSKKKNVELGQYQRTQLRVLLVIYFPACRTCSATQTTPEVLVHVCNELQPCLCALPEYYPITHNASKCEVQKRIPLLNIYNLWHFKHWRKQ